MRPTERWASYLYFMFEIVPNAASIFSKQVVDAEEMQRSLALSCVMARLLSMRSGGTRSPLSTIRASNISVTWLQVKITRRLTRSTGFL